MYSVSETHSIMPFTTVPYPEGKTIVGRWVNRQHARRQALKPKPEFVFEIKTNAQGHKVLYFPFMSVSDTHAGSNFFRANRTAHMLENTEAGELVAVGDIVDLEHMREKSRWNFAPYHRQFLAHLLRKGAQYFPGNHDEDARGKVIMRNGRPLISRGWIGKRLFNVNIINEDTKADPKGLKIKIKHGDEYDRVVFGRFMKFFYKVGDALHSPIAHLDHFIQDTLGCHRVSVAATLKKWTKTVINSGLGVEKEIMRQVDADASIDGLLYGHSHMGGIKKTPGGKILINDGHCTEHVQFAAWDKNGTKALFTWHKGSIDVEEINGSTYTRTWKQLGIESMKKEPSLIEDEFTKQADRLVRLIYRLAPPKDRQKLYKKRRVAYEKGRELPIISKEIQVPPHPHREEQKQRREMKVMAVHRPISNNGHANTLIMPTL